MVGLDASLAGKEQSQYLSPVTKPMELRALRSTFLAVDAYPAFEAGFRSNAFARDAVAWIQAPVSARDAASSSSNETFRARSASSCSSTVGGATGAASSRPCRSSHAWSASGDGPRPSKR